MKDLPWPKAFSAERFHEAREKGMQIVDVRSPEAFAGTHIAESFSLPLAMLPAFGGMFLEYDRPIGLVVEDSDQVARAQKYLSRIGYDRVEAFLADGLHGWETSGLPLEKVGVVDIRELGRRIEEKEEFTLLDVRSEEEFESGHLPGAVNIYLGELPNKMGEISQEKKVTTFCGSGQRAMVAASYLLQQGFSDVEDCLGSLSACESIECDLIMT
jgi:hydroxyacylglutathione hydrolase